VGNLAPAARKKINRHWRNKDSPTQAKLNQPAGPLDRVAERQRLASDQST
jgi:hypothetical protein